MNDSISHTGILVSLTGRRARVRIVQSSSCAACKIASYCSSAESKEKYIDAVVTARRPLAVGDEVEVSASASVGAKAVVLAFAVPTLILLAVIIACLAVGVSEPIAAAAGFASLVPYYAVIYACRSRLEKELTFVIA